MFYSYQYFLTCLNISNISSYEFFIIIAGNVFDPIQVWNKNFPVNYFCWIIPITLLWVIPINKRGSGRQIRWKVQYIMHPFFDDTSIG